MSNECKAGLITVFIIGLIVTVLIIGFKYPIIVVYFFGIVFLGVIAEGIYEDVKKALENERR